MPRRTADTPAPQEARWIEQLVVCNHDSFANFEDASEQVDNPQLAAMFREIARQRTQQAQELEQFLAPHHEEEPSPGVRAAAERSWMDLRGAMTQGDAHALLAEAERGEAYLCEQYGQCLREVRATHLHDLLAAHLQQVQRFHEAVRDLRDTYDA